MRACPSCGAPGIREHSVLVGLHASSSGDPTVYSQCVACRAVFERVGPGGFVPREAEVLTGRGSVVWIVPPWKGRSDRSELELSWDVVEAFFERLVDTFSHVRPLFVLIGHLRAAGLDATLRAGQSLSSLGLSRAREHGLRPGQSHLFLAPRPDGTLDVSGTIACEAIAFGPVLAAFEGPLREAIERLAAVPIE